MCLYLKQPFGFKNKEISFEILLLPFDPKRAVKTDLMRFCL